MVVGVDEVGRGSWAGPLIAAAVLIDAEAFNPIGITDSKKLSSLKRERLYGMINVNALAIGIGWVSSYELDRIGLSAANRIAMERAVSYINLPYDRLLIDGNIRYINSAETIVHGDAREASIGAASIIAKVTRDRYMASMELLYPGFSFATHVGYGTPAHSLQIKKFGVQDIHRKTFKPIKGFLTV